MKTVTEDQIVSLKILSLILMWLHIYDKAFTEIIKVKWESVSLDGPHKKRKTT